MVIQDVVDLHGKRCLNAEFDASVRSLTNAVNPDGSSGTFAFQSIWVDPTGAHWTLTVNVAITPGG